MTGRRNPRNEYGLCADPKEVLRLYEAGKTGKETARLLGISVATVNAYRRKLGLVTKRCADLAGRRARVLEAFQAQGNRKSIVGVARALGLDYHTVRNDLKVLGLTPTGEPGGRRDTYDWPCPDA